MTEDERIWHEERLRTAVLAGDERAWQTLYDGAFTALYAFASWRCGGCRNLADDVVQETWLQAVRSIRRFEPKTARFQAWLRGIAHNVIRNHLRRSVPKAERLGEVPSGNGEAEREQAEHVAVTLAALPAHYESVLRAKYVDQLSVSEIAASKHESIKAVESLLTRARQAFREAFDHEDSHR